MMNDVGIIHKNASLINKDRYELLAKVGTLAKRQVLHHSFPENLIGCSDLAASTLSWCIVMLFRVQNKLLTLAFSPLSMDQGGIQHPSQDPWI